MWVCGKDTIIFITSEAKNVQIWSTIKNPLNKARLGVFNHLNKNENALNQ